MPIPIDSVTHKKLVLVKSFYQHALTESAAEHSTMSRLRAVIEFDLALETVLKAAFGALDPSVTPPDNLNTLLQKCDAALATRGLDPIPEKTHILYVHKRRNAAQHEARYPNPDEVSDCRTYTRDSLEAILTLVWGTSIEAIRLTDLVKHEEVRGYLDDAEKSFSTGNYKRAVTWAGWGLETALSRVREGTVGKPPQRVKGFVMDTNKEADGKKVYQTFDQMQRTLLYVALGISYAEFMRYRRITGPIALYLGDDEPILAGIKKDLTVDEAEFVLGYCIDTVAQIEELVGSLDAPYGREWWF